MLARPTPRDLARIARTTTCAGVAWFVASRLGDPAPVPAVLVPVLANSDDPFGLVTVSVSRLAGVVAGGFVGLAATALLPTSTPTVVLVVGLGLLLGSALRVAGQSTNQVAVSALLVLAATSASAYSWRRLWETGVGAAVSVLLAPLLWPGDRRAVIQRAVDARAEEVAGALVATAGLVAAERVAASAAVEHAQRLVREIDALVDDVVRARRASRFNLWQRTRELDDFEEEARLLAACALDHLDLAEDTLCYSVRDDLIDERVALAGELPEVAAVVAAAMRVEVTDHDDDTALAAAWARVERSRTTHAQPVAAVLRRPLLRVLERIDERRSPLAAVPEAFSLAGKERR